MTNEGTMEPSSSNVLNRRGTVAGLPVDDAEAGTPYGSIGSDSEKTPGSRALMRRHTFIQGEQHFKSRSSIWNIETDEESMGDTAIVINLLADLSPAGTLPLAAGMIGTGYIPSICLLLIFAAAAAYMMYLISRTIEISGAKSYDKIWEKVIGKQTAWVPACVLILVCFGNCLAYACMFGDLFSGCMPAFGFTFASRTVCLVVLACFPLLPLCMLKDLSALAPTSFGALVSVAWMITVMVIRYADGSYLPGGQYHGPSPPSGHVATMGVSSLLLVNSLAVGFLCHYNGCKYYREYIDHRPTTFANQVSVGFGMVSLLFAVSMLVGYATFGSSSQAVILNNYSESDSMANIARFGMGLANVFSFPLMFSGLRENALALLAFCVPDQTDTFDLVLFQNILAVSLLALIITTAVILTDASLVVGLVGSICGSAIIYVIPCFLFASASKKFMSQGEEQVNPKEMLLVQGIGCTGIVLMIAGASATFLL
eukprot:TRINITY_DN74813_c0_g1_i1.p1 TRINITY_DN74813_c0_g1~~TRINITY_DN74813_c0_g1_i1.p1  ORF type:complete len:493 (-),score=55.85 TRINITY_DN74813_c0_g1_i1:50-1501(-)